MARPNLKSPKILTLAQATAFRRRAAKRGEKVVLTNGVFDLLHPGHTSYLAAARRLAGKGGHLVVALNSDASVQALKGPLRPILDQASRAYNLAQLASVDAVFVFSTPRLDCEIRALQPDIYCKAGDYTVATLDAGERAALLEVGAKIRFLPFLQGFSTTLLIEKIRKAGGI
ncbi:MAG TPA: adenylyltransferase/cytidyltransferase family protein [Candidatus Didemnitutus sp.]|nr:adenylyltransferase/cytidyltransferase family protein [Candidatus Didemnitutus sp.]